MDADLPVEAEVLVLVGVESVDTEIDAGQRLARLWLSGRQKGLSVVSAAASEQPAGWRARPATSAS
ncbi:hypothetical protein, partial [Streptomyces acidiscabies]|uniref:hypothetical protein n=1 Tax=Streptomyces acidiscabies TaxID=42234 RepID=UPI002116239A